MTHLLILCGGQSPEHSISIRSTRNILSAIDRNKYDLTIVGISQMGNWWLVSEEELQDTILDEGRAVNIYPGSEAPIQVEDASLPAIDVVFPLLHGPNGEDGTIQGLLKLLCLPFVGPAHLSSAVCMDKEITKRILRDAGILVAPWEVIRKGDEIPSYQDLADKLGEVLFVKPANMGSSVGVHRVSSEDEWRTAIEDALKYDRKVLVEQSISGRELECAVLGNEHPKASGVGEVQSGNFYSYSEKYDDSSEAQTVIPANIDHAHVPNLQKTAVAAYKALDCQGMSRVDMFITEEGQIFINEVNTIPGFTSISMYPKLWEEAGIPYAELIDQLITLAMERGS